MLGRYMAFVAVGPILVLGELPAHQLPQSAQQESMSQAPVTPQQPRESVEPRVPGQTQTQEEWEAGKVVEQTPIGEEQSMLARRFLGNFPESGLTPNAHYVLAVNYQHLNDFENFAFHAEKAVQEIPNALLLAELAFLYSEQDDPTRAIERANRAIEAVATMKKPASMDPAEWADSIFQLQADTNYALGRAYLSRMNPSGDKSQDPNLIKAAEHLERALEFDPGHDFGSYRLGFVQRNLGNIDATLEAYARAVAIGQVAAAPARGELEEILAILKEQLPESAWASKSVMDLVNQAKAGLGADIAQNELKRSQMVAELQQQLAQPVQPFSEKTNQETGLTPPPPPES